MIAFFQKVLACFIILVIPVFISVNYTILRAKKTVAWEFSSDFLEAGGFPPQKEFVFILTDLSDKVSFERNLTSIFEQTYPHYRIILIETNQTKKQLINVQQLAGKYGKQHLLTIYPCEEENLPTIHTYCEIVKNCHDEEIVVQLAASDWLSNEDVLERLNREYANDTVWLTYSQCLEYPSYKRGNYKMHAKGIFHKQNPKKIPWVSSPFKTYYAGLFKQIRTDGKFGYKQNLLTNNIDLFMLPLAENSFHHIHFIDETLYIHSNEISGKDYSLSSLFRKLPYSSF